MKIYVASSWRNNIQPGVVRELRAMGHEVYDYRHPAPDDDGFSWCEIDPGWENWSPTQFMAALDHSTAIRGYDFDHRALNGCDACVLVLPSARSAHLEAGFAKGAGKPLCILLASGEPELMYKMADRLVLTVEEVCRWIDDVDVRRAEAAAGNLFVPPESKGIEKMKIEWRMQAQFVGQGERKDGRTLALVVMQTGAIKYMAMAVETAKVAAIQGTEMSVIADVIFADHQHNLIGEFDGLAPAIIAAENYAVDWSQTTCEAPACDCGPITTPAMVEDYQG